MDQQEPGTPQWGSRSPRTAADGGQGALETDPLLVRRRSAGEEDFRKAQKSEDRQAKRKGLPPVQTVLLSILGPWLTFLFFSLMFLLFNHGAPKLVAWSAGISGSLYFISAILSLLHDTRALPFTLALCALAVALGSLFGAYNYYYTVHNYYLYLDYREYSNVWADEPADAHRDAAAIVFARGNRPDLRMPTGYTSAGHTFCVAPVVTRDNSGEASEVQYWAVGRDCCDDRGFTCDDAAKPRAVAGFVIHTRSTPIQAILPPDVENYMKAVNMAKAKFDLRSAATPILVRWVQDLDAVLESYWDAAWTFHLEGGLAYLALSAIIAMSSKDLCPIGRPTPPPLVAKNIPV